MLTLHLSFVLFNAMVLSSIGQAQQLITHATSCPEDEVRRLIVKNLGSMESIRLERGARIDRITTRPINACSTDMNVYFYTGRVDYGDVSNGIYRFLYKLDAVCDASECIAEQKELRQQGTPEDFDAACAAAGGEVEEKNYSAFTIGLLDRPYTMDDPPGEPRITRKYKIEGSLLLKGCHSPRYADQRIGPRVIVDQDTGMTRLTMHFDRDDIDGLLQLWNADGSPSVIGTYERNYRVGEFQEFSDTGRPLRLVQYERGDPVICTGHCFSEGREGLPALSAAEVQEHEHSAFITEALAARDEELQRRQQAAADRAARAAAIAAEDAARLRRSQASNAITAHQAAKSIIQKNYTISRFGPENQTSWRLTDSGWYVVQGWLEGPNGHGVVIRKRYTIQVAPLENGNWVSRYGVSLTNW